MEKLQWIPLSVRKPTAADADKDGRVQYCTELDLFIARWDFSYDSATHWLPRNHIPPVPKPETQGERDKKALGEWWTKTPGIPSPSAAWHAALAWERSRNGGGS